MATRILLRYDPKKLQRRMLECKYNYHTLGLAAGVTHSTAKNFVLTGKAQEPTVTAICRALKFRSAKEMMKEEK